jgi:hypothetical protein
MSVAMNLNMNRLLSPSSSRTLKNFFQFWKLGEDDETLPNFIK